ncbi:phosphoglycolate phosphatase [Salinisphaera sp. G21_0]|uniref:phosphoglycolate phosphatase n=1 Tax=Salinisphaera sp. G21_0 TaxID=2821094 RepID=UPI001ADB3A35|nr:phosphoglycolate phosphatase [Salinisphaera sp. G21_0]MBO9483438.1 phosphoglycolate phosphatase [Salinisphaera sp. G21_0]
MTTSSGHPFLNNLALVMYDLDGTLIESAPDLAVALDKMLLNMGRPAAGESKTRLWVGNGIPALVKRALADDMHGDQPGRVDSSLFETAHECFKSYYSEELGHHSYLYPGVSDFLEAMKDRGIKQVVITNKSAQFTDRLLQLMGIDHYFDLTIGGDSLSEKKPHPLPLLYAMQKFNCPAGQSLMIGDSVNDILAARAAGVRVVGLPYGYNHGEPIEWAKPDLVIASLTTLLQ